MNGEENKNISSQNREAITEAAHKLYGEIQAAKEEGGADHNLEELAVEIAKGILESAGVKKYKVSKLIPMMSIGTTE